MRTAVLLGVVGVALGSALAAWLRTRAYRHDDEVDEPRRGCWWVVPVVALGAAALGDRYADDLVVLAVYLLALVWMAGLAAIDLDVRRLPDRWTLPAYPVAVALLAACSWSVGDWSRWWIALACGAATGLVYLALAVLNPAGLGLGDVKLAGVLGLLTGWFGWPAAVAAFLLAFLVGLAVGVVAAVRSGEGRKATFPFGPSMLGGALLVVVLAGVSAGG